MHELMHELWPLPRSLTGDGVRATLAVIGRELPLETTEVPTGTQIFDWTAPREWNLHDAWIEAPDGTRVLDLADSTLHVLGYSTPIRARVPLAELREHVFVHDTDPDRVPYRTSYWSERWGFCMSRRRLESLPDGDYEVCIDATLADGAVTYGEVVLPGEREDELLLSTYVCHPALANDNLSGVVMLAALGHRLRELRLRHTVRLLWSTGTIGPLCWLHVNRDRLDRVKAGLVVSCVGDLGSFTYKRSRRADTVADRAVELALRDLDVAHTLVDWFPWGGDERQFCAPGFDLPVGAFSRTPADRFPEYHSSADDLDFVRPEALAGSYEALLAIAEAVDANATWVNTHPFGEPQLGRRGLYRSVGGGSSREAALLWLLSLGDGRHDLLEVARRSGMPVAQLHEAALQLAEHDLLSQA